MILNQINQFNKLEFIPNEKIILKSEDLVGNYKKKIQVDSNTSNSIIKDTFFFDFKENFFEVLYEQDQRDKLSLSDWSLIDYINQQDKKASEDMEKIIKDMFKIEESKKGSNLYEYCHDII